MAQILKDKELLDKYQFSLQTIVSSIDKAINDESKQLLDDVVLGIQMLYNLHSILDSAEIVEQAHNYCVSMYFCSLIEKALRVFYCYLAEQEIYIPKNDLTLGSLLRPDNQYLLKAFEERQIKNLVFFLSHSNPDNIGHDYRNSLAHLKDIEPMDYTLQLTSTILLLFTDVINTIFLYLYPPKKEDDVSNDQL